MILTPTIASYAFSRTRIIPDIVFLSNLFVELILRIENVFNMYTKPSSLDRRQHFQSSFALDRISISSFFRCVDGDAFPRIECARTNVSRDGQLSHPRRAHLSSYFWRHFCFSMPLSVRARVCGGARRKDFTFRNVSTSIPLGDTTHSVNHTTVLV